MEENHKRHTSGDSKSKYSNLQLNDKNIEASEGQMQEDANLERMTCWTKNAKCVKIGRTMVSAPRRW